MNRRVGYVLWTVVLATAVAFLLARPAHAAAPRLILVYGDLIGQPVLLSDWHDNLFVLAADERAAEPADLTARPSLELALFWSPEWDHLIRAGYSPESFPPEQASQRGRFYPAIEENPALLAIEAPRDGTAVGWVGWRVQRVRPEGLAVLARHGIPVYLPASIITPQIVGGPGHQRPALPAGAITAGLAPVVASGGVALSYRRRVRPRPGHR